VAINIFVFICKPFSLVYRVRVIKEGGARGEALAAAIARRGLLVRAKT
jgi:hypothetical protein